MWQRSGGGGGGAPTGSVGDVARRFHPSRTYGSRSCGVTRVSRWRSSSSSSSSSLSPFAVFAWSVRAFRREARLARTGFARGDRRLSPYCPPNSRESRNSPQHTFLRRTRAQPFRMCVGCRQVPSSLSSTADDHHLQKPPLWTRSRKMIRPTHQPFS